MTKRIPIKAAKDVAKAYDCLQVILAAWDGYRTHIVTYGATQEDCEQAANEGKMVKKALGWPRPILSKGTPLVKKLFARIHALERALEAVMPLGLPRAILPPASDPASLVQMIRSQGYLLANFRRGEQPAYVLDGNLYQIHAPNCYSDYGRYTEFCDRYHDKGLPLPWDLDNETTPSRPSEIGASTDKNDPDCHVY